MIGLLGMLAAAVVLVILIVCPIERRGRGRHVSRPLGRRAKLDQRGVIGVQAVAIFTAAAYVGVIGIDYIDLGMQLTLVGWFLDDHLTGGSDDDRKRKHEPFKVRLRMPKPVKLRPAERWAPMPA